jgi:hypothetical protein
MLQAHSFLYTYLWLGPHVLQIALAVFLVRRGLHRVFPIFFAYLVFEAAEEFTLYTMDVLPSVDWHTYWFAFCLGFVLEGLLKIAVLGELFATLVHSWPMLAALGNRMLSGIGATLVLLATVVAAYAPIDNPQHPIISRAHILEESFYIIQCGLILFLFLFAAYFRVRWKHQALGVLLGFGIVACEHLAVWAVAANGLLFENRSALDLLNMGTYHFGVLLWFYFLLVPEKITSTSAVPLPDYHLEVWNRELERLFHP